MRINPVPYPPSTLINLDASKYSHTRWKNAGPSAGDLLGGNELQSELPIDDHQMDKGVTAHDEAAHGLDQKTAQVSIPLRIAFAREAVPALFKQLPHGLRGMLGSDRRPSRAKIG